MSPPLSSAHRDVEDQILRIEMFLNVTRRRWPKGRPFSELLRVEHLAALRDRRRDLATREKPNADTLVGEFGDPDATATLSESCTVRGCARVLDAASGITIRKGVAIRVLHVARKGRRRVASQGAILRRVQRLLVHRLQVDALKRVDLATCRPLIRKRQGPECRPNRAPKRDMHGIDHPDRVDAVRLLARQTDRVSVRALGDRARVDSHHRVAGAIDVSQRVRGIRTLLARNIVDVALRRIIHVAIVIPAVKKGRASVLIGTVISLGVDLAEQQSEGQEGEHGKQVV